MPQIPSTITKAFALPRDLLVRYDPRRLAQLVVTTADPSEPLPTSFEVENSPLVLAAIGDATEIILAAAQVGMRYLRRELEELSDDYDPIYHKGRGGLIIRLTCDIAFAILVGGKGQSEAEAKALAPRIAWAEEMLERLKLGERVFDLDGTLAAGKEIIPQSELALTTPKLSDNTRAFGCIRAFRSRGRGGCCGY